MFGQEKRAQRLTFWVRRPPGGVGVFHAKGWWLKSSCPPSKVCLPWVLKRGIWDVPGILPGISRTLGGCSKSLCKRNSCAFFVPYSDGFLTHPYLLFLAFLVFLAFPFQGTPCDFERFCLLSQGFLGFGKQKKSWLFWWFSLLFSKKARKRRSGKQAEVRELFEKVRFLIKTSAKGG